MLSSVSESARLLWFAAYVRSRHETRVSEHLEARSVEFFLPQEKSERQWSDRRIVVMKPLFPNYIFVRIAAGDRMRVLEVPGVVHLVGRVGQPEAMEDAEIEQLRRAAQECMKPQRHPLIAIGERVMVTRGPLEGAQGLLVREKGRTRVVLELEMIGKAMSVEVDMEAIAPVGSIASASYEWAKGMNERPWDFKPGRKA
jgi:transcription elongation factor/antiterminator RfaH